MSDLYGYSFSPDLSNKFRSSLNNPSGASQLGPQVGQALKVLSLHLPAFAGGAPIAPDALLRPSHPFTPDAGARTGMSGVPAGITQPPQSAPRLPSIPFGGGGPDFGGTSSSANAAPGLPTISFGGGNPANPVTEPPSMPAPGPGTGSVGSSGDQGGGLGGLLDAFLRSQNHRM